MAPHKTDNRSKKMIFKRAQYRYGGARNRLITGEHIVAVGDYLEDQSHPNHKEVKVAAAKYWRSEKGALAYVAVADAERYRSKPRGRGKQWGGEIAEHVIFAPPSRRVENLPAIRLEESERNQMAAHILSRLCPHSPAVYAWHLGEDGRDELHILVSNFEPGIDHPRLRITALRDRHDADYMMIGRGIGESAVEEINQNRSKIGKETIPTLAEIRAAKRRKHGHDSIAEIVFGALGAPSCQDRDDIVSLLRSRGWSVRPGRKHLSVTPPGKSKSYRIPWETLLFQLSDLRERWLRNEAEKHRDIQKNIEQNDAEKQEKSDDFGV